MRAKDIMTESIVCVNVKESVFEAAEIVGRISFTEPSTIVARKLSLGRVSPPKGLAALNAMSSGWVQNLALSAVVSMNRIVCWRPSVT